MRTEAHVPISLEPPLRPFRPEDAAVCARLNDAASHGLAFGLWKERAADGQDPWDFGTERQIARMEQGQIMVVCDPGNGCEAVMMGNTLGPEPDDPVNAGAVFEPLVELENLVLDSWYLNVLATVPEAQRRGHGARLLAVAEDIAKAEDRSQMSLITLGNNAEALSVYHRADYVEHARRPTIAGDDDWVLLVKDI